MTTSILWRPEVNPLTSPQSYWPRHIPRATFGNDEIAARIARRNPLYSESIGKGFLIELAADIKDAMINGNQVKIDGLCTCHISLTGRLDAPDDPLAPPEESLQIRLYPSKRLQGDVRQDGHLEQLAVSGKLPVISSTTDTVLKLKDVLNSIGLLRVTGTDLFFDPDKGLGECVLEGTRNGRIVQSRFGPISNSEFTVLPDIPSQTDPWNNEYRLTVSTRYTENGTLRTGTYLRMLRTPLGVNLASGDGILCNGGTSRLVTVTGGTLTSEGARVRIQAVLNAQHGDLRLSLLDMKEDGAVGNELRVNANGSYTLTGYPGSYVTDLELQVNDYESLLSMVRTPYGGRLVDILDLSAGS